MKTKVLDYWFGSPKKLGLPGVEHEMQLWFGGSPEIDADIRHRWLSLMDQAVLGELDSWMETADGALALIILLDQFSLNIYRDQARSFTQCHRALPYALEAIRRGYDRERPFRERMFFYLPLEHAEDIHLQNECLRLFARLVVDANDESERKFAENLLDYAKRHQVVIERFGRFPDRNSALGRDSTPDEQAYLDAGGPDF